MNTERGAMPHRAFIQNPPYSFIEWLVFDGMNNGAVACLRFVITTSRGPSGEHFVVLRNYQ